MLFSMYVLMYLCTFSKARWLKKENSARCPLPAYNNVGDWDYKELKRFHTSNGQSKKRFEDPSKFKNNSLVYDIGSYVGIDIVNFMNKIDTDHVVRVHAFEPVPSIYAALQSNVRAFPTVVASNFGLGSTNAQKCFNTSGDATFEVDLNDPACKETGYIVDIAARIPPILDFLHINCEGCEFAVLKRLIDTGVIKRVRAVEVQFHKRYVSRKQYCKIDAGMRSMGFRLVYRYNYVWELWEQQDDWDKYLNWRTTKKDWCPTSSRLWLKNLYRKTASRLATRCNSVVRVGGPEDGGKLICAEKLESKNCVVYSLGSRLDFSFEIDVVRRFGCTVHTFDCTVGVPTKNAVPPGVQFHPWCVGGRDGLQRMSSDFGHQGEFGTYFTLSTIQRRLGHARVDLLKMDIERHEFAVIQSLSQRARPTQIAFETHLHNAYGMWKRPVMRPEWMALWSKLEMLGYRVYSHEPNSLCLCCCEFSVVLA